MKEKVEVINLTIDGRQLTAEKGETLLDCALRHGIKIPNLCTHPRLSPFGACRLCVVEIDGMRGFPTSCTTPAEDKMVVKTNTDSLRELRRNILALIMLEHPNACLICGKRDLCEEYRSKSDKAGRTTGCHTCNNKEVCEVRILSEDLGLSELPVAPYYHQRPLERSNPFIDRDLNLCILCGRCVRICKQLHGSGVIDFVGRSSSTHIGEAFGKSLKDAGCRFCGACIDVCPTGSLSDRYAKWYGKPDRTVKTTCLFCPSACTLEFGTKGGKVITAKSACDDLAICVLGRFAVPEFLSGMDRLRMPYVQTGTVLRQTEWQDALNTAGQKLKPFAGAGFALVCDKTSAIEDRYVFKKFTNEVMKSADYIEITPDSKGVSKASLPKGVKAVLLTGDFVDPKQLEGVELVIVQDCYPTPLSKRADMVFPAAVFAEIEGTIQDGAGRLRPLYKVCDPPGEAKAEWQIICELAKAMDAGGFDYKSVDEIRKQAGVSVASLQTRQSESPAAAKDPKLKNTHFRGHQIDQRVCGLKELADVAESTAVAVPAEKADGFKILEKREIVPNIHEIVIYAPHVAKKAMPGQFIILMVDEKSERVPYTMCDWDAEKGTITLVVLEMGQSSRKLVLSKAGDMLAHVVGPLGLPLDIRNYGTVILAAGCYGIGAIFCIAKALKKAGNKIIVAIEARSHYLLYYKSKLADFADEFIETTIDGSAGVKGHALDVVGERLKGGEKIDLAIAVGCPFMMMLTAKETKPYSVKTLAALNPIMVDGTGMCGACRVTVGDKTKFACVDGPFFDAHQVDWDEVKDRRTAYSSDEIHSISKTDSVTTFHSGGRCMDLKL